MASRRGTGADVSTLIATGSNISSGLAPRATMAVLGGKSLLILISSLAYFGACVAESLASEIVAVERYMYATSPRLVVRAPIAHVVVALLGAIAVLTCCLMALLERRQSGVLANPSSLATAASLLGDSAVVADLRRINPMASIKSMALSLRGVRFRLVCYREQEGNSEVTKCKAICADTVTRPVEPGVRCEDTTGVSVQRLYLIREVVFGVFLLGTLGFVIAYVAEPPSHETGFNNFMNGQSFGPRFIMAGLGSLIEKHWNRLERGKFHCHSFIRRGASAYRNCRTSGDASLPCPSWRSSQTRADTPADSSIVSGHWGIFSFAPQGLGCRTR